MIPVARIIIRFILRLLFRAELIGYDKLAGKPLIVSNHQSFIDYLVIDSTSPLGMKTVIALLESGAPVVSFPEGRITVTGSRMKVYDGPAFAAAKSGAQVLPIHI